MYNIIILNVILIILVFLIADKIFFGIANANKLNNIFSNEDEYYNNNFEKHNIYNHNISQEYIKDNNLKSNINKKNDNDLKLKRRNAFTEEEIDNILKTLNNQEDI